MEGDFYILSTVQNESGNPHKRYSVDVWEDIESAQATVVCEHTKARCERRVEDEGCTAWLLAFQGWSTVRKVCG